MNQKAHTIVQQGYHKKLALVPIQEIRAHGTPQVFTGYVENGKHVRVGEHCAIAFR